MWKQNLKNIVFRKRRFSFSRWVLVVMMIPMLCIILISYQSIQARLMDFLEAEGSNMVRQISSAVELYLGQVSQEIRRMCTQDTLQNYVNFQDGQYYENLRMQYAREDDAKKNYQYVMLKKRLLENFGVLKEMSEYIQQVSLTDERKEIVLYSSGATEQIVDGQVYIRKSMFNYDQQIIGPIWQKDTSGADFVALLISYVVDDHTTLMVTIDYGRLMSSLISRMPAGNVVTMVAMGEDGNPCWSLDGVSDEQTAFLTEWGMASDEGELRDLYWSDGGRYLGVRCNLQNVNGALIGLFQKSGLMGQTQNIMRMVLILLSALFVYFLLTALVSSRYFSHQLQGIKSYLSGEGRRRHRMDGIGEIYDKIDAVNVRYAAMEKQLESSLAVHRSQFLSSYLRGELVPENLQESLKYLGIDLRGMHLILFVGDRSMRINDLAFMEMDEMLSRLFDKKDYLYTAMPNNQLAVIIRWRQGQHEELCLLIKKLVDKLEDMTDHLYFAGVSRWTEGFGSLCQAYAEVMKTLRLREAAATEQVFYAGKMRTRASTPRLQEEKKAMLCESIRQGNLSGAVSCFDGMFPEGGDAGPVRLTLLDVRDSLVCLYGAVVETLSQIEGVIPPAFDLINTLTLNSYQALRIHFRQYVCEAAQAAEVSSEDMDVQYRKKLEYAIASIPVEELSLERVAEALNVTPTHFSHMFRKYTGGKFIDYMTELRLRRAEELLSNTTLPVTEIAIRVGWAKTSYFNQRFKQHYGVTPGQYRRMHGGEEE